MTQAQAISKGYTHFIEVWRSRDDKEGVNVSENLNWERPITNLDIATEYTKSADGLYTVCIFLCKLKTKQ